MKTRLGSWMAIAGVLLTLASPSHAQSGCLPGLSILGVAFTGTDTTPKRDKIKIDFQFTAPGSLNTCLQADQIRFDLTVTRKNGHQDTETATVGVSPTPNLSLPQTHTIFVERGLLETDPQSYSVKLTATHFVVRSVTTIRKENGQIVQSSTQQLACCVRIPSVTVTDLRTPDPDHDSIRVSWTRDLASSATCMKQTGANVSVKATHVGGSVCSGSQFVSTPTVTAATVVTSCPVEFLSSPDVAGIEATIEPQVTPASTVSLVAQKSGTF